MVFETAADPANKARLLAACSPGSGDWLEMLSLSTIGLKMDNASIRIAVGLRLGAPVVRSHICVCGAIYGLSRLSPRLFVSLRLRSTFKT
jgi:hypothetical protein